MEADGDYVRFVETTVDLIDASARLPRRARFGLQLAIVGACESERIARSSLASTEPKCLERASDRLCLARATLADASRDAAADAARRRSLSLVV